MSIQTVQLGSPRARGEGLRIGTARRPPRGVRTQDLARKDYYDVWLPELAPSQPLVSYAMSQPWNDARWAVFRRRYLSEMRRPAADRLITLLAVISRSADFSIGCYCDDESRCHRTLLRELLEKRGGKMVSDARARSSR